MKINKRARTKKGKEETLQEVQSLMALIGRYKLKADRALEYKDTRSFLRNVYRASEITQKLKCCVPFDE